MEFFFNFQKQKYGSFGSFISTAVLVSKTLLSLGFSKGLPKSLGRTITYCRTKLELRNDVRAIIISEKSICFFVIYLLLKKSLVTIFIFKS